MGQWLPVSTAVLLTVIEKLPSPKQSQKERLDTIIAGAPGAESIDTELMDSMRSCDNDGPVSAYISKMISIPREELPLPLSENHLHADLIERSRKARNLASKAAKHAETLERLNKIRSTNNQDVNKEQEETDLYQRAKETVATPELEVLEVKNHNQQMLSHTLNEAYLDSDFNNAETDHDEGLVPQFTPSLDPNDPLASMFEYEEEDPFEQTPIVTEEELADDLFDESDEVLVGFARVYSGMLRKGQEITVLGPKYDPKMPTDNVQTATITDLYMFMGRELVPLEVCPPGNIVGIRGLAGKILKNGTLIEKGVHGVNLAGIPFQTTPIVRVAVESTNPVEMSRLSRGLKLLNQADPCVETYVEDSGEHILCTAGELHLERCLKDLRERFAGIEITSSEPAIPYRETFLDTPDMNPPKHSELGRGSCELVLGPYKISIQTIPLPDSITQFLITHESEIRSFSSVKNAVDTKDVRLSFMRKFEKICSNSELTGRMNLCVSDIASLGPKRSGPNIISSQNNLLGSLSTCSSPTWEYSDSLLNGFQLAVSEGPLSKEPVQGMFVLVQSIKEMTEQELDEIENPQHQKNVLDISGRLITSFRDCVHESFLDWSPRMMWAMYSCDIQTSVEVLGKVYAVVQQRRGKIVSEEMKEGTPFFQIEAHVPVIEAFGFSEDIRKRTSGSAQPQLVFAGFECIDMDPFWVPTTEEELEELGDTADKENIARKHMNAVRRRKGLFINEKVIQNAEKQRTLKKN